MAIFDKLLVPTDFSDSAEKAYLFAEKIASRSNARCDLIHVIPDVIFKDEQIREKQGINELRDNLYPHLFNEAELSLSKTLKSHFPSAVRGEYYVKVGRKPSRIISEHAWNGNYSLIVMSAKGKDESEFFRGSTTEAVIRNSKVPVLRVYHDPVVLQNGRIVVPVDGSLLSMAAIPAAAFIASLFSASITLLYVNQLFGFLKSRQIPEVTQGDETEARSFLYNRLANFLEQEAPDSLTLQQEENHSGHPAHQTLQLKVEGQPVSVSMDFRSGLSAHHEITSYANQFAGLVVMTTHGRSGLQQIVLGSNAEKVALNTNTSVLTIRPDSKLFTRQHQTEQL